MYIAHRGLHNDCIPENSLGAFQNARKYNFAIELDIRMTKDNVLVIFHDADTYRLTGNHKIIEKSTYEELEELRLKETDQYIPTLQEVLTMVDGKVFLDIEIKRRNCKNKFLKQIEKELSNYKGQYSIKSFDPLIVRWYKKRNPQISCGVLSCAFKNDRMPKFLKKILKECYYVPFYKPDFLAYSLTDFTEKLSLKMQKYNIPIMLWTIRNEEELAKAKRITSDIVFENIHLEKKGE
ncbi:MAG: glycerophosphodiester phosphodiesterase [Bacilli bacterium]|nr:glycerophosphodiester phosphodiesterase [Bacilli bacterium]